MTKKISFSTLSLMLVVVFGMLFTSCKKEKVVEPVVLAIGDFHEGGVIFYLFEEGETDYVAGEQHGLVCDVNNIDGGSGAEWGCYRTDIANLTNESTKPTTVGDGAANTAAILAGCATEGTAADLCANSTNGAYSDWFLPSLGELNQMYLNKTQINTTSIDNSGEIFGENFYWSSSEFSETLAWQQNFSTGHQNILYKEHTNLVRAVRAF